jgi:hypothetical protein
MTTGTAWPRASEERLGTVLSLLAADAPRQIARTPDVWPRWAVLLPHVLATSPGCGLIWPPFSPIWSSDDGA